MRTEQAIQVIAESITDEKQRRRKLKELESEAWEDFLDMTISQALVWAGQNIAPEETPSEVTLSEPYFIGSHSGASGAWVSGPADLSPPEYHWGYNRMATVEGMFCAGDASGASSHKFSSGSCTEGRIAAKGALAYILDHPDEPTVDGGRLETLRERIFRPLTLFEEFKDFSSDPDINPNFIKPRGFMFRLQKLMDEYGGGTSSQFITSEKLLDRGIELLALLREDAEKLAAEDLHELMRCWENVQRMWIAESHLRHMRFRQESRWPGYYLRSDCPEMDQENWKVFVNSKWNPQTGEWEMMKKPVISIVP